LSTSRKKIKPQIPKFYKNNNTIKQQYNDKGKVSTSGDQEVPFFK